MEQVAYSFNISLPFFPSRTVNPAAVDLLSTAMLRAPEKTQTKREESRRLIPISTTEEELRAERRTEGVLTAAEHDALLAVEGDEASRKEQTPRVAPRPTPHPNEIFFLKVGFHSSLHS